MIDHDCACHGFAPPHIPPCSVLGGCGHLHRDEVTEAKFRLERRCVMPGHGQRPRTADYGLLCHRHAADVRDLLADVYDLCVAYSEGDVINPERTEHRTGRPHAPIPINLNRFLIGNPGGDPVQSETEMEEWLRYGNRNPVTGRRESNGPDAPDVWDVIGRAAKAVAARLGTEEPGGDTLARLDFIRLHLVTLTEMEGFLDFVSAFKDCRRALALAIGEQPGPVAWGPCPDCGTDLFTDRDREVIRRRRSKEPVTGPDAAPFTSRADRVACHCGAVWEGVGLTRLRLILHPNPPQSRLEAASDGNGWMVG